MARLQISLPLSVLIALGRPLVLASCSRIRTSWVPPSARSSTMVTASWGCVIHFRQALDAAPLSRAIKHEVHGPHLVGVSGLVPHRTAP